MRRVLLPLFLLVGGGVGLWLLARQLGEEPSPRPDTEWGALQADTTTVPQKAETRALKAFVPFSPADLEDGRIPRAALREERDDGSRIYETSIGPITLSAYFAERGDRDMVKKLGQAMHVAERRRKTVAPDAPPWTFESLGPLGSYLRHPKYNCVVSDVGIFEAQRLAARDTEAEVEGIRAAVATLMTEVRASTALDVWLTSALDDLLARLDDPPGDPSQTGVEPDFVRQIVSDPAWLRAVAPEISATARTALVEAVRTARAPHPSARFECGPALLTQFSDAWRERGRHLRLGRFSVYFRTPPVSFASLGRRRILRSCRILYMLPGGAHPLVRPEVLLRTDAMLLREGTVIATWNAERGIGYDYRAWRRAFPRYKLPVVDGHWPPHVPIVGPDGTLYGIGTDRGFLRPPRNGGKDETERFVTDAARLLPTAAHLDLLQQYFVRYCLDSPSIAIPLMIGSRERSADIHQTVGQMLATATEGVCRGDCDDFAELCHAVATRQGNLAHVISLPGHLATMWAENWTGEWRAYVLQTGPTLEFRGPELLDALSQAYLWLAPDEPFDRQRVLVSLRFAGENTRSEFGLPASVFKDADHAKTMIAIQGDWHASRYLRVLRRMRRLSAKDKSLGTLAELASICARLELHSEAADLGRCLLAACTKPESRVLRKIEWSESVLRAGRRAAAEAAVTELLEVDLPALAPELGLRTLTILLELARALSSDPPLEARVLARTVLFELPALKGSLASLLQRDVLPKSWREHEHNERLQRITLAIAWAFVDATTRARAGKHSTASKQLETVAGPVDVWLERYAFDGVDATDARDRRWTLRATRRMAAQPGFLARILRAAPLAAAANAEDARGSTDAAIASHARTSVRFLATVLIDVACAAQAPDPALTRRVLDVMADATRAQRRLGLQDADGMNLHQRGCLAAALIARDERGLRDALLGLRLLNNRYDTGRAAYMIGRFARHADAAWWKRVIRTWGDVMQSDVHDFHIVWTAHGVGANQHALAMSALASRRAPGNEALQEEARLYAEFMATGATPEPPPTREVEAGSGR